MTFSGGFASGGFSTSTYEQSADRLIGPELMGGIDEQDGVDPVDAYFACITTCSLDDGECITICTEQLRASH